MKKPKYSIGTRVKHISKNKWGTIIDVFESGKSYRYYVRHSGYTWSVPEEYLTSS